MDDALAAEEVEVLADAVVVELLLLEGETDDRAEALEPSEELEDPEVSELLPALVSSCIVGKINWSIMAVESERWLLDRNAV